MSGWFDSAAVLAVCIAIGFAAVCARADESDVLYWMVDSAATVTSRDGTSSQSVKSYFDGMGSIGSDSSFAARVRVIGGGIADDADVFLSIYNPDLGVYDGTLGVDFRDTGSDYWGSGVPNGSQSPSGDYSAGSPEYSFIVELGNIAWNSDFSDGTWTTVATSAAATYSSLANYIQKSFDLDLPQSQIWTPVAFVAVPEPSSGLLTLVGFALLALRRGKIRFGDR